MKYVHIIRIMSDETAGTANEIGKLKRVKSDSMLYTENPTHTKLVKTIMRIDR